MATADELNLDRNSFPMDRYEPIRLLGKGALGEVYLAKDKTLGRTVAVKCLLTVTDEQVVAFHREAKIASKLSHAHVIGSLDFGTTDSGRPYLALEYFDGISLEKLLEERCHLSEDLVTKIFLIVAEALGYIHNHKIFHRDLKPSNILLKLDDANDSIDLRIIDFGLSSIKEEFQTKTLMQGRTLVGTPLYMSPDQVNGGVYDARSEVYSLACLMFESLTGAPPFSGDRALEILEHHAKSPPPLLADARPDLDFTEGMQHILSICLAKSKDDRFHTMTALIDALQNKNTFNFSDENSRNQTKRLRVHWTMAGTILLLLILGGAIAFVYNVAVEPPEPTPVKDKPDDAVNSIALLGDPVKYMNRSAKLPNSIYIWGEENFYRIEKAKSDGTRLETLTLRGLNITSKEINYLVYFKTKAVYLNHCVFDSEDIIQRLSKISTIEKLGFYSCSGITPQSLLPLKSLTKLTTLVLEDCSVRDDHLKALSRLNQVQQFVFDGNNDLTINGIKLLARNDQPVVVWVNSGALSKLSLDQIEILKKEHKIMVMTNSMDNFHNEF